MSTQIETIDTRHTQRAPGVSLSPTVPATETATVPGMVLAPDVPQMPPVAREKE